MVIHSNDGFSQGQNGVQNNREMVRDSSCCRNETRKKSFYIFRDFDERERDDGGTDFMGGNYASAHAVFSPSSFLRQPLTAHNAQNHKFQEI